MSGHWRFCAASFLLVAALSTSPASSNPLTDLFNPAPKEASPPAPAAEPCLLQPGKSSAPGQHWVYHLDGRRKCWFQVAEEAVPLKKPVQHHFAKRPTVAREENEAGMRRQKAFVDARAQLPRSAPAETQQPSSPAPEVVDAASVPADGASALVPPEPVVTELVSQPAPDRQRPRQVDVEMLLAGVPSPNDTAVSSMPMPKPSMLPDADKDDGERMATQAGLALVTLGLVCLFGPLVARRFLESRLWSDSSDLVSGDKSASGGLIVARQEYPVALQSDTSLTASVRPATRNSFQWNRLQTTPHRISRHFSESASMAFSTGENKYSDLERPTGSSAHSLR